MENIKLEIEGRIAIVSLNTPERLNAMSDEMLEEIRSAWQEIATNPNVRVAMLRGEGRAFCAGADLGGLSRKAYDVPDEILEIRRIVRNMLDIFFTAWELPKPIVTQVHGYCYAGGTLLAGLTDIIVVAEDAEIGWPKMPIGGGLIGPIWSWFVGPHRAKEFSLDIGHTHTGREAVAMGWGNYALPADQVPAKAMEIAERIARVPAEVLMLKKAAINQQLDAQGFKQAAMRGADMDALIHSTATIDRVNEMIGELGFRDATQRFNEQGLP